MNGGADGKVLPAEKPSEHGSFRWPNPPGQSLEAFPLSPVPSPPSPSQFAALQDVCRGFMLFFIHIVDVVLQQKQGPTMTLLGTGPGDQGMSVTAMTRAPGGSRTTLAGCERFPKPMPDPIAPRPRAASSSSPVDHSAEVPSRGTAFPRCRMCTTLPRARAEDSSSWSYGSVQPPRGPRRVLPAVNEHFPAPIG